MKPRIKKKSDLLYPEQSYSIIGAAMDVHSAMGPGWNEWDYHRAMIDALVARGHAVVSHDRRQLEHRGVEVDRFELDLLVDEQIILELKHLKMGFLPGHIMQLINYLKCWDKRLGMLINFGQERLRYQRIPYSSAIAGVVYSGEWGHLPERVRDSIELAVRNVLVTHGHGFGADVFKKVLVEEFKGLRITSEVACLKPGFQGKNFEARELDAIALGIRALIRVVADGSATDLACMRSYIRHSDAKYGVLVEMGKRDLNLRGVL